MKAVVGGLVVGKVVKNYKKQPADGIYHIGRSDGLCRGDRFPEKIMRQTVIS